MYPGENDFAPGRFLPYPGILGIFLPGNSPRQDMLWVLRRGCMNHIMMLTHSSAISIFCLSFAVFIHCLPLVKTLVMCSMLSNRGIYRDLCTRDCFIFPDRSKLFS